MERITPSPDIILGGDFNLPHINWPGATPSKGASVDERNMLNIINDVCNSLLLTQIVTSPTHKDGNTLDLVFVNNPALVHSTASIPVLQSTSHHSIVQVSTTYKACPTNEYKPVSKKSGFHSLNFYHNDVQWDKLLEKLSGTDWIENFENKSPDDILSSIYDETYKAAVECVPEKTSAEKKFTGKLQQLRKKLVKRKRRITKRLCRITSPSQTNKLRQEHLGY